MKMINYENGLRAICPLLSDKIIQFCDFKERDNITILFFLLENKSKFPFEIDEVAVLEHFKNNNENLFYKIRDYIIEKSRETIKYLRLRLALISERYNVDLVIHYEDGPNTYYVAYTYKYGIDISGVTKSRSDLMDVLDCLEIELNNKIIIIKEI